MRNLIEWEIMELLIQKTSIGINFKEITRLKYLKQARKDWIRIEEKIERMKK